MKNTIAKIIETYMTDMLKDRIDGKQEAITFYAQHARDQILVLLEAIKNEN